MAKISLPQPYKSLPVGHEPCTLSRAQAVEHIIGCAEQAAEAYYCGQTWNAVRALYALGVTDAEIIAAAESRHGSREASR